MKAKDVRKALRRKDIMVFISTELTPGCNAWVSTQKGAVLHVMTGIKPNDEIVGHIDQCGNVFVGKRP